MRFEPIEPQEMKALMELSRGEIVHVPEPRKTLRDEFAMAALLVAQERPGTATPEKLARLAYEVADAMLAARQAKGE